MPIKCFKFDKTFYQQFTHLSHSKSLKLVGYSFLKRDPLSQDMLLKTEQSVITTQIQNLLIFFYKTI